MSHSETFESWRAEKASHFETLGDFRLREVSHGESFEGCGLRKVSHGESWRRPGPGRPSAWRGAGERVRFCGAWTWAWCLAGRRSLIGFGARGRPCIRWYGAVMRLGKGRASPNSSPTAGLPVVTPNATKGLLGVDEILLSALYDKSPKEERSDN